MDIEQKHPTIVVVRSEADADRLMESVQAEAARVLEWIAREAKAGNAMALLKDMKFEAVGFHPIGGHKLNLIEQVNQTWTYAVAIAAARQLLTLHPDAGGFRLAPGAHAGQDLDIMSVADNLVGAETFAAVHPKNNGKLAKDLSKMSEPKRMETHRYVFFMSPAKFPGTQHRPELEAGGPVKVWSVDI